MASYKNRISSGYIIIFFFDYLLFPVYDSEILSSTFRWPQWHLNALFLEKKSRPKLVERVAENEN